MANGTIATSITDTLAVCSNIIESANNEVAYLSPPSLLVLGSQFGLSKHIKTLIKKGGRVQGITDFSYQYINEMLDILDTGTDLRHFSKYQGIFMLVGDRRESISSMGLSAENLSIDTPVVFLWSDNSTYAEFLVSTFKTAWGQSMPATQRIEELLKEGPPSI